MEISNLNAASVDKAINLSWTNPTDDCFVGIVIEVKSDDDSSMIELSSDKTSYSFTTGTHGATYSFNVYARYKEGDVSFNSSSLSASNIFINSVNFTNPVMKITLPEGLDDITTKTWLDDQNLDLATCTIIDNSDSSNNANEFKLDIKGRGNSSWDMPKKSYSLKLEKKNNLLNLANGKHKKYALIANYCDKTLLRNQLAYYMGTDIFTNMDWNPHTRQVNLFINDKYYGIYMLTERISINKNVVDIPDVSDDDCASFEEGGWIVEVNGRLDETYNWITNHNVYISLKDPEDYEDWTKIEEYINEVEDVLFGDSFTDEENGWRKYLDEESFIDWYLVNEIAKNTDADWRLSVFMYFNPNDGRIHMGPLWDFDIGFGNVNYYGCDAYEGFLIKDSGWHAQLFKDGDFVNAVKERWNEKKDEVKAHLSTEAPSLSSFAANLEEDAKINFSIWPILGTYVWPNPAGYEDRTTYQSEVEYLKNWLNARIDWLDENISLL